MKYKSEVIIITCLIHLQLNFAYKLAVAGDNEKYKLFTSADYISKAQKRKIKYLFLPLVRKSEKSGTNNVNIVFVYKDTAKHSHIPFIYYSLHIYIFTTTWLDFTLSIWMKIVRNKIKKKDILIFFIVASRRSLKMGRVQMLNVGLILQYCN